MKNLYNPEVPEDKLKSYEWQIKKCICTNPKLTIHNSQAKDVARPHPHST